MTVATYLSAARSFADLVDRVRPEQWDGYGLGDWDVRALAGHTSRALLTVLTYLDQPAAEQSVGSSDAYLAQLRELTVDHEAVTHRGRAAGEDLGDDPGAGVRRLVDQIEHRLAGQDLQVLVPTIVGGMTVANYLPTRTFELVVHGFDLARATGQPVDFEPDVLTEVAELAARVAVRQGSTAAFLFAVTGRPGPGFSIV